MRKVKVGHYIIELDEELIRKYEQVTCGKIETFAETYVRLGFKSRNIEEITSSHSLEEIKSVLLDYIKADIEINE